jgi:UDP-GlcNAc:undecaprenyl-phosphate GlcNAc-1-phosphate transferase
MAVMIWICFSLVAASFVLSLPLAWLLVVAGRRLGHVDAPGAEAHKVHAHAVPNIGGIAVFAGIVVPLVTALLGAALLPASMWGSWLAPVEEHLPGLRRVLPMALAVIGALASLHFLGLIDDRRRLSAPLKLGVQVAVASVLVIGFDMRVLQLLDGYAPVGYIASVAVSILWIVAITNAMNMLDNMDGLSAGVGAIIAGLYLAATLIGGQWFVAALAALLLGALLGFLVFNFPSARLFMGDGGSLVLGLMLAIISIRTTYFHSDDPVQPGVWYGMLMPLMVLAVPLYDLVSVVLIRIAQGRSPMMADRSHFSHRLVDRGLSAPVAVLIIWLCTLATGLSGVMLSSLAGWQAALAAGQTVAVVAVLALLEGGKPKN